MTDDAKGRRPWSRIEIAGAVIVALALILAISLHLHPGATLAALQMLLIHDLAIERAGSAYEQCAAAGSPYCVELLLTPTPQPTEGP